MSLSEESRTIVSRAAGELLSDLDEAEQRTQVWQDAILGEALVSAALGRCLASLAATGLWGRDNRMASNEFWRLAGKRLECGSLQWRARFKPRGYAGDFETLAMFCDGHVCDDLLGRLFDRYFQNQTAVEAVRSRTDLIAAALSDEAGHSSATPFRVASIGCGPAIDVERGLRRLAESGRRELTLQLLDLDEDALFHAAGRLAPLISPSQWTARRENLYRLAERPNAGDLLGPCHMLICTGFLDYLVDEPAKRFLSFLWQRLEPGGVLYVGNFAPHNPSRAYMEWIGNWYLLYRSSDELDALAEAAGIPGGCRRILAEQTGVDLFLCARKL